MASCKSEAFVWYRKLKTGDESDIDAVYTNSDVEEATEDIEEKMEQDFDDENLEPWLDNDIQEIPYNTDGW